MNNLFEGIPPEDMIIAVAIFIGLLVYFYYSFLHPESDGEIIDDNHHL